ncbi:hypothetical protein PybrP1_003057, partial [[Pythium] brassicae (nom. inval.)]
MKGESASPAARVVPPTVKKGDRLAQFLIFSALSCVAYQFVTSGDGQLPMKTSGGGSSASQFGSSEYTCLLACLGLFGLIRHKTKEHAAKLEGVGDDDDGVASELRLAEKRVRSQRRHGAEAAGTDNRQDFDALTQCSHADGSGFAALPQEVLHEVLLFLDPRALSQCPIVSKRWNAATGDDADALWRLVFARDFRESGERFRAVFPIASWRQFYFQHHLSRAVELARLLGLDGDKKLCVAIENQVYDVTSFIHSHPGGYHVIGDVVGTDATAIWEQFQHSAEAKESMKEFIVHDAILNAPRREATRLRGNLNAVLVRWQRLSWCLANAHNLGPMASAFTDVMFKLYSRSIKKSREASRL